jgi:MFS family permease
VTTFMDLANLDRSIYYAMAVIWPSMVAVLYTTDGGASMYAGWLSCAPSAMINLGQIMAGFLAVPIGKTKFQCMVVLTLGGSLLGGMLHSNRNILSFWFWSANRQFSRRRCYC